jgi:hypothetical protein
MEDFDKPEDLVPIGTHLTRGEFDSVKSGLTARDIHYEFNEYHATSHYSSYYYEVKVKRRDRREAQQILGKINAKAFIESRKCPKCKTLGYTEIKKRGLWEKVYYFGTTLNQCQKCKTKYAV